MFVRAIIYNVELLLMVDELHYAAFWRSLDHDTQEVIRRMDEHENLGHQAGSEITEGMINVLVKIFLRLEELALKLTEDTESYESHLETILLILSFTPNAGAYWFIKELIENQPEIYQHLYTRVMNQEPLQIHGKLVKERLYFHFARQHITQNIYSPENCLALRVALKGLVREKL